VCVCVCVCAQALSYPVKYIGVRTSVMYLIDRNLTGVQESANITTHISAPSHTLGYDTVGVSEIAVKHREERGRRKTLNFPITRNTLLMGVSGLTALILKKRK
jgi:hypothetical protein